MFALPGYLYGFFRQNHVNILFRARHTTPVIVCMQSLDFLVEKQVCD